jgi:hypothetical protein
MNEQLKKELSGHGGMNLSSQLHMRQRQQDPEK